ncbi:phage tail length tape measure family protein, partial [Methylobacterium sp. WL6]|uniref:phage tail length tape measure family protein n=1 Tax=Methylobacterium sp. WL6 TaxID=2603901 RepID=UPI0011D4E9F9
AKAEREVAEAAAAAQRAMEAAKRAQDTAAGKPAPVAPVVPGAPAPALSPVPGTPSRPPANAPGPAQGAAAGLRPDQWKNLGFQTNDILTSLFSGIPVTQVIAQQGGQVTQVLADAPGGIAGGLKIVASRAMEVLTPVRLMAAGFLGAAAGAAYLGVSWVRSQEQIRTGLLGIGAQSRATVADVNRIAETATSGGRLSRGDARGVAGTVAAAGKVDVSNIPGIVDLAPGYAKLFGKDLAETGADLAKIFADPVKGADELNARMGGLDAGTRAYIRTLTEQGDRQGAIQVLVRTFASDIKAAADKTTLWAKAWNLVSTAADAAGGAIARPFTEKTPEERLAAERERLRQLRGEQTQAAPAVGYGLSSLAQDQLRLRRAQASPQNGEVIKAQEEKVRAAEVAAEEARSKAVADARAKSAAELSEQAEAAVRSLQPEIDQLETLNSKILLLQKTQSDLDAIAGLSAQARKQYTDALASARGAVETFMSAEDKARASEALTIRSIEARTVAQKASIAAERERIALAGRADVTPAQRAAAIKSASDAVLAQSTRDSQDRLRDSTDANASAGLLSYPRQRAELEARYRKLFKENEGNLPAIANLQKSQTLDAQAIDKEAIGGPLRDANRSLTEQIGALKLQQDAFGASTEAATRMAEAQRLSNTYAAAGIPITAEIKRGIDAYAASAGKVAAAQEDLTRKQREIVGGMDDFRSGSRSTLTGIFSDVSQGKSPVAGISSSLNGVASRLFERSVATPLVNGALGLDGKAGGGIFGDALSGIFGKAQTVSTAQISAGVVNLSGSVSGIPGLGGTAANSNVPGAASAAAGLTGTGDADMDRYAKAIRKIESGSAAGDYSALGTITKSGDRAYGAYQVMGNNIPSWTQKALGKTLTKEEFLADKGAQDAVFRDQFGASVKKYGNADDAASVWLSGKPLATAGNVRDANGTSPTDYVSGFRKALPPATTAADTAAPAITKLDASLKSVETTAGTATQGVSGLTSDLGALPGTLTQTSQGVTQLTSSLGSNGGGLMGVLSNLFGGGASAGTATAVTAATGGHIRGPGTSTSDSIVARLSDGEFVVNAAATRQNLSLLHAINDNRMPAFAEGGPVGQMRAAGGGGPH